MAWTTRVNKHVVEAPETPYVVSEPIQTRTKKEILNRLDDEQQEFMNQVLGKYERILQADQKKKAMAEAEKEQKRKRFFWTKHKLNLTKKARIKPAPPVEMMVPHELAADHDVVEEIEPGSLGNGDPGNDADGSDDGEDKNDDGVDNVGEQKQEDGDQGNEELNDSVGDSVEEKQGSNDEGKAGMKEEAGESTGSENKNGEEDSKVNKTARTEGEGEDGDLSDVVDAAAVPESSDTSDPEELTLPTWAEKIPGHKKFQSARYSYRAFTWRVRKRHPKNGKVISKPQDKADFLHAIAIDDKAYVNSYINAGDKIHRFTLEFQDDNHHTPLHHAILCDNEPIIRLLLQEEVDVAVPDFEGWRPLHHAVFRGKYPICEALVISGADVDHSTNDRLTPLMIAALKRRYDIAAFLIEQGALLNEQCHKGWTALHYAAYSNAGFVVELLLDNYAELELEDKGGATAMDYAEQLENGDAICALIEKRKARDV